MIPSTAPKRQRPAQPLSPVPRLALTLEEARAALGGLNEHDLRELIRQGKIATWRTGTRIRLPVFAIEDYLREATRAEKG